MSKDAGPGEVGAEPNDWIVGPIRLGVNLSADAAEGIHNEEVATAIGFRGGTVAGDIHLDQFAPVLVEAFGESWFESGSLSLYFKHATLDGEPVIARVQRPPMTPRRTTRSDGTARSGDEVGPAALLTGWLAEMRTPEGIVVAEGTASVGAASHANSALRSRDLRGCEPSSLRILSGVTIGEVLDPIELAPRAEEQQSRLNRGLISEPLTWYSGVSPWGGPIASPLTAAHLLHWEIAQPLSARLPTNVGMFGAIEIAFVNGPIFLDRRYVVSGRVVAVSDSPKTEILWYDTEAHDLNGQLVATCRMMTRLVKASSPLYLEVDS
jgi:hypothetical protein